MSSIQSRFIRGFTLLETMISLVVLGILVVSVFSITIETYAYIGHTDVDYAAQAEATQSLARMTEILRKCGRSTLAGVEYPRITGGGSELEFRILKDLDGNGYPFSAATGEPEWGTTIYSVRIDGGGNLRVFNGTNPVWHLCRHADQITFSTYRNDPLLQLNEIGVTLRTRKFTQRGEPIDFTISGTIDMRN